MVVHFQNKNFEVSEMVKRLSSNTEYFDLKESIAKKKVIFFFFFYSYKNHQEENLV